MRSGVQGNILYKHHTKPSDGSHDGHRNRPIFLHKARRRARLSRPCRTTTCRRGRRHYSGGVSRAENSDIANLEVGIVVARRRANDVVIVADACACLIENGRISSFCDGHRMSTSESNTFLLLTKICLVVSTKSIPGESSENERTSTKCYIKNELLWLEESLDVATCSRPVADWSTEGRRVNRALVI